MSGNVPAGKAEVNIFVIAGEHSGDALGGKLMAALRQKLGSRVRFTGVGDEAMQNEGLVSDFPMSDVTVMGPLSILRHLPRILKRVYGTVDRAIATEPRRRRHHRQPRVHAPDRQAHQEAPPRYSDRRLCEPERLGLAAWPRQENAPLCRSHSGPPAVRA